MNEDIKILVLHKNLLNDEETILEMDNKKAKYYTNTSFKNEQYSVYIPIIEEDKPTIEASEPIVENPPIEVKKVTKKHGTTKPAEDHSESTEQLS